MFLLISVQNSQIRKLRSAKIFEEVNVKFESRKEKDLKIRSAIISCKSWMWSVNLISFESIHGISRIVLLIPDKLRVAIEINQEKLENPKDDGSFFIDLILDLVKFYSDQIKKNSDPSSTPTESQWKHLLNVLDDLTSQLTSFKAKLQKRDLKKLQDGALKILKLADDLRIFCQIYLDFVHPVLVMKESENSEKIEELKENIEKKLSEKRGLREEFEQWFSDFLTNNFMTWWFYNFMILHFYIFIIVQFYDLNYRINIY